MDHPYAGGIRRNSRSQKVRRAPIRTVSNSARTPRTTTTSVVGKSHFMMFAAVIIFVVTASYYCVFLREMSDRNHAMNDNSVNLRAHKTAAGESLVQASSSSNSISSGGSSSKSATTPSSEAESDTPMSPATEASDKTVVTVTSHVNATTTSSTPTHVTSDTATAATTTTIAYLTSVTACPADQRQEFIDAAAVLKHSIHQVSIQNAQSTSKYDYHMYAFVHVNATECAEPLRKLGYRVLVKECPVALEDVQNDVYRARLANPKAGCCQEKEFLKLYSYTMHDYPLVVHLDMDFLLFKPMDDLFDAFFQPDDVPKDIPNTMWPSDRPWNKGRIEAMFTRDYPMAIPGRDPIQVGMQGGFFIVRPNQTAYDELVQLVRQGNFNGGWYAYTPDGERVKYPGFYGAAMIQGLIGFYYGHFHPGQIVELNRCYHNNMADRPRDAKSQCFSQVGDECMDCRTKKITDIHSIHFTFCLKPWTCPNRSEFRSGSAVLCSHFHEAWHRVRHDFEKARGIAKPFEAGDRSFGHCLADHEYLAMEL